MHKRLEADLRRADFPAGSGGANLKRPVVAEIDLDALAANTAGIRRLIGSGVRFYGVCKGDAYGIGLEQAAPVILESGADALAVADPKDVVSLHTIGVSAPLLLYPSTPPDMAADVATLGAIVSLTDLETIAAFATTGVPVAAHAKVDCGFGRLGLVEAEWTSAFAAIRQASNIRLVGLYTHLGHTEDRNQVDNQIKMFRRAIQTAEAAGFDDLEYMAASSRVVIGRSDLRLNAINPGRALYGWLEAPWTAAFTAKPVLHALTTRVIQVKSLPPGSTPGYLDGVAGSALRVAVLATGFADGLPRVANGLPVLIRGREARVLGMRSTEHTVVDVTQIPGVAPGDEAVLLGRQGDKEITPEQIAAASAVPLIELLPRLARSVTRRYSARGAPAAVDSTERSEV